MEGASCVDRTLLNACENSVEVMLLKPSRWYVMYDLGNIPQDHVDRCWQRRSWLAAEQPVLYFLAMDAMVVIPSGRLRLEFIMLR